NGHPEIKIFFDHQRLAQLGLTAPQVSKLLATKVGGSIASQYSIKDKKIDILVRVDEASRNSVNDIKQIIINPKSNKPIPLAAVADVRLSVGPSEITRIDQQRAAVVSANFAFGDINSAVSELKTIIRDMQIPLNISANITGQNEEMDVSFTSLVFALLLAVFLVYLVMASQFESLLHPLLILFTVPLAAAGSIYGLYLTNTPLSVIVFIGLIMLAGIVVNNAIVLVDRINQLRESGMDKIEAIKASAISRLRPIIMTTLTTTLGLLPLAISVGEGSEIRAPMAITVIFGLLFATLLTLFFIPILYSLFDRKRFGASHD
ncbi:MAG: efflux RND transporter permease subunit, partial [Thalassotalea sp.]|nr:efflux RND transporter permease subunit [Thalassotalea sp.]